MRFEYKVINLDMFENAQELQDSLNALAQEDWRVICDTALGLVLVRESNEMLSARVQQFLAIQQLREQDAETWSQPEDITPVAS